MPGAADEQADAQASLQARHAAADRRRCHARGVGGRREAAELRGQAEDLDAAKLQIVEMAGHGDL
ncbi:hypothetical protein D3C78_1959600 [compost metagenome]